MKRILVAVDFSDAMDDVLEATCTIAHAFSSHLYLLHVEAEVPDIVGDALLPTYERVSVRVPRQNKLLLEMEENLTSSGFTVETKHLRGMPIERIVDEIKAIGADLVVMGAHKHGKLFHAFHQNTSDGVLHAGVCPVLIVPHAPRHVRTEIDA